MQTNLLRILQIPSPVYVASAPNLTYANLRTALVRFKPDVRMRYSLHKGSLYFIGDCDRVVEFLDQAGCRVDKPQTLDPGVEDLVHEPQIYKPIIYNVLEAFFHFKGFERAGIRRRNSVYVADQAIAGRKIIKPWGRYRPEGRCTIMPYDDFLRRNDTPGKERRIVSRSGLFVHEGFNYHIETIDEHAYLAIIPRTFIIENRVNLLNGGEYSSLYTTANYNRHNWEIRTLLYYWASYLADTTLNRRMTPTDQPSGETEHIVIAGAGGSTLTLNRSYETVEEDLWGELT